jgi:hypothetical protein
MKNDYQVTVSSVRHRSNENISAVSERYKDKVNKLETVIFQLNEEIVRLKSIEEIEKSQEKFRSNLFQEINNVLIEKSKAYKWITGMISDFVTIAEREYVEEFEYSGNRKVRERVLRINDLKNEKCKLIEKNKALEYELEYIRTLIPESVDIVEFDEHKSEDVDVDSPESFLSKEEYAGLSDTEKNIRALNHYKNREKRNWEIGRDFERYVGYLFERHNYKVEYYGIDKKLEDLGRDLIVENEKNVIIVQCKYWSKNKTIHEKHIAQLFGTFFKFKLDNPNITKKISAQFVSHTTISDTARAFAKALGIIVVENVELKDYPIIKCNVGRDAYGYETKIYHFPLDQQYDTVKIIKEEGDFYAMTVEEAEAAGFRRAYKWHGI